MSANDNHPARPDFATLARDWLVTATGHASPTRERALALELERIWELGVANAIEALRPEDADAAERIGRLVERR